MRAKIIVGLVAVLAAAAIFAAPAAEGDKAPLPGDKAPLTKVQRIAKGKDLVDSICFWCHEPELMNPKHLDQYQWADLIRPMIYEGAPVTDEEFGWIVEYLSNTFGPVAPESPVPPGSEIPKEQE